eukprot:4227769-Pyramimonas_sp.AAC.1
MLCSLPLPSGARPRPTWPGGLQEVFGDRSWSELGPAAAARAAAFGEGGRGLLPAGRPSRKPR